jgi:8-oxo-dGTP pyrophosphatase MutT (NUDIX family)
VRFRLHAKASWCAARAPQEKHREILLVTCPGSGRWIIPKGHRSKKLDDCDAAAREADEEGGVKGKVSTRPIGKFTHCKANGKRETIEVYPLKVKQEKKQWQDAKERKRAWVSPKKAKKLVEQRALHNAIDRATT